MPGSTPRPGGPPPKPPGLLLLHAGPEATAKWAPGGLAEVVVAEASGWSLVVPTSPSSAATAPYDDAMTMLLNRPLPHRLRPAIGFAVRGRRAVIAVTPGGWRAVRRWLVWEPGTALTHPPGLPVGRLSDLVGAAHVDDPSALGALADVLHDPAGTARDLLGDILVALDLPGGSVLDGSTPALELPGAHVVEPSARDVRRFDRMAHEDSSWRDEMEGQHP